jgi:hypothetical protein
MDLLLTRDSYPDHTYGTLEVGTTVFQTMELPWIPDPGWPCGEPLKSCVPPGYYHLMLHDTVKHPKTWALENTDLGIYAEYVPPALVGRNDCLLHAGNYASDSEGCVLIGIARGTLNGQPAILNSQTALIQLKTILPWISGHTITIS